MNINGMISMNINGMMSMNINGMMNMNINGIIEKPQNAPYDHFCTILLCPIHTSFTVLTNMLRKRHLLHTMFDSMSFPPIY